MKPVVRFAGVGFAAEVPGAGRPANAELWRGIAPHADAADIAALTHAWQAGEGNDGLAGALALQHPPAGASAALVFCDEDVQFETRPAGEKNGWCDLA